MILMRANPFRGPWEVLGPENCDFLFPKMANERSECNLGSGT